MANGSPAIVPDGVPPWLKTILQIILQQGVAAGLAIWLVWMLGSRIMSELDQIRTDLRAHMVASQAAGIVMTRFADSQDGERRATISLLRQVCVNTARTDDQLRECVQ